MNRRLAALLGLFLQPGLHFVDLGLLMLDSVVGPFAGLFVLAVLQADLCQLDRALALGDHRAHEGDVGIVGPQAPINL